MNLQKMPGLYQEDNRLKNILGDIVVSSPQSRISLLQIRGSAITFLAAALWKEADNNHVFVLNDRDTAAYFQNDLQHITDGLDICYFPDSYKKTGNYTELNTSSVMLRTEALSKFVKKERHKGVLVTYPEALFEKVVDGSILSKDSIQLKVNEAIDLDKIMKRLTALGFKREDFVYEPGQFTMRGGIFDIYSFGNENPYRIELFGNDIDSIRIFNPESQLSERKLLNVTILPNVETAFEEEHKVSLIDYLPDNTVYWFQDYQFTKDKLLFLSEKLQEDLSKTATKQANAIDKETQAIHLLSIDAFEEPAMWERSLLQHHLIDWSYSNNAVFGAMKGGKVISFSTELQPAFNRNFELLSQNIQQYTAQKYAVYVFAENPKQLERLHSIFVDTGYAIVFNGIPQDLSQGFIDHDLKVVAYTDHQLFQRYHKYKIKQAYSKGKALSIKALKELQPGDFVSHIDHGVGRYSGLQKIEVNGAFQEAVRIIYKDNDVLYVNINSLHKISKYTGKDGTAPKIHKLGSDAWAKIKNKTKKQVKDIAADLIKLYAKRKASSGFAFSPDSYLQTELESSFIYEDTPDQHKATEDVKRDMEQSSPMDRLVCGDVGFGKTEVAVRAAFKAATDGKQVAVLVPTTILAIQHYQTFKERLADFPVTVDFINRFKSAKQKRETIENLESGKVDILIGTHAVVGKSVKFKDLGLLIIDEEQKFGVGIKEKLRERKANVDTLTLTATPIPRTLQFSLMAARDLSIINTPPPNRQPVDTELIGWDDETIRDAIYYETNRGGQVYFVHNRVQSLPTIAKQLQELCPDISIGIAHGQMEGNALEETLMDFINHKFDVLCSTNIVESGVDISNANTILVNNAHQFGMSDLHQLRGRVGRSNKKAFCYLLAPSLITLPDESRKRLQTLEQFNELGSGFQIAMRDLDIRGAGNLLGGEQSGFIADIGFEMYQKILAEAIRELKSTDFKEVFADEMNRKQDYVSDFTIDTDWEILIPDTYVENVPERLALYTHLDHIDDDHELARFEKDLIDRFGPLPKPVQQLFLTIKVRKLAKSLGFEKLIVKNHKMRLYFLNNPDSSYYSSEVFNNIMQYVQTGTNMATLKQIGTQFLMIVDGVHNMDEILFFLEGMILIPS